MICATILRPIVVIVRTLVRIAREIVTTVCGWVTSTITVVREVCEEVCGWLGPFSFLCDWVCNLVEVVETITEWVCEEVIETIFEWVERLVEWVIYVLEWVCWVIDWIFRWLPLLLCRLGLTERRTIRVCVKVLADRRGNPAVPLADVQTIMEDADRLLEQCSIDVAVVGTDVIIRPEALEGGTCEFDDIFDADWAWFNRTACQESCTVTVYFVRELDSGDPASDLNGCAIPGTNWVRVDNDADGATVVHEIGHLADLWEHTDDPDNIMTDQPGGTGDQITEHQCCMIRTSRFACVTPIRILDGVVGRVVSPLDAEGPPVGLRGGPPQRREKKTKKADQ
jgi:hypothetical protein